MFGIISSYNPQKRCGCIREKETNEEYFFGVNSVVDSKLRLKVGNLVRFELLKISERKPVAIRIVSHKPQSAGSVDFGKEHVDAVVIWYDIRKKYGYVQCQVTPRVKAFLHQKQLLKVGLSAVESGQKMKVKLVEDKYPGKPACIDVIVEKSDMSTHIVGKPFSQSSNFTNSNRLSQNHVLKTHQLPKKRYTSNDYSAIPCSSTNSNFNRPRPVNSVSFANNFPPHMGDMPPVQENFYFYNSEPRQPYFHSTFRPQFNGNMRPWFDGPHQQLPPHQTVFQSNPPPCFNNMYEPRPNSSHQQIPTSRSRPVKTFSNPECAKINQEIQQKQGLLKALRLNKVSDRRVRLEEQIKELKAKLKELCLADGRNSYSTSRASSVSSNVEDGPVTDFNESQFDTSIYYQTDLEFCNKLKNEYCSGEMVKKGNGIISQVAREAVKELRSALSSCPPFGADRDHPDGLLVDLQPHQRQALTWLCWREGQPTSGGVLAYDSGLGKTITMISLILAQMSAGDGDKTDNDANDTLESESTTTSDHHVGDKVEDHGSEIIPNSSSEEHENTSHRPTLLIVPPTLIYHWEREISNSCKKGVVKAHLFLDDDTEEDIKQFSQFDIVITTYDIVTGCNLKRKASSSSKGAKTPQASKKESLFSINWRRIVLDEADVMRHYESDTAQALCLLSAQSRWALYSAPVHCDQAILFSMMKFLRCRPFHEYKLWKAEVDNDTELGQKRLNTLVASLVLRREKETGTGEDKTSIIFPKQTITSHEHKLSDEEQKVHDKLKSQFQMLITNYEKTKDEKTIPDDFNPYGDFYDTDEKRQSTSLLAMLLRLLQCCGHLGLLREKLDRKVLREEMRAFAPNDMLHSSLLKNREKVSANLFPIKKCIDDTEAFDADTTSTSSKVASVMEVLRKLRSERPDDKCVLVSHWTGLIEILAHHLGEAEVNFAVMDAALSGRERMDLVDDFNRNAAAPKILLISTNPGSVVLNLTGANHLFLLDTHLNAAAHEQILSKIHNVGQSKEVFVHKFKAEGTIEEQLIKLQESGPSLPSSASDSVLTESQRRITIADIKLLFRA